MRIALHLEVDQSAEVSSLVSEGRLRACLNFGERTLPARIRPLDGALQGSVECVLDYPFVETPGAVVCVWDSRNPEDKASIRVRSDSAKWESRFNRRVKKKMFKVVAKGENDLLPGHFIAYFQRYFEGPRSLGVWRVVVEWQVDASGAPVSGEVHPSPRCINSAGEKAAAQIALLEEQRGVTVSPWLTVDRMVYSIALDRNERSFIVVVSDDDSGLADGFCCMDPGFAGSMMDEYWTETRDACGDDSAYRAWLLAHRPSSVELALQRRVQFEETPMFSVIVPCFNSNEVYLHEAVSSVLVQSYQKWELLLLDASSENDVVKKIADGCGDFRVRYCKLEGNGGIVSNTNKGIALSKGDYVAFLDHDDALEPDALFRYAEAIASHGARVLYCDEDSFHSNGDYGQPSFKSDFNRDLLYSHNYVTHFLVVQKALIGEIGYCSEEVSGAQDYDLVLRALGAGCEPYHVPHILYHWRIHEGSSNDGNVGNKPYAVEAGKIALQGHFDSRGIACRVESLSDPFVYRVRYSLPDPKPLVSVIIPTQDKAEMLSKCVESLFASSYQNLEVVLVENGSRERATEELYSRLQEQFEQRMKVVRWSEGFNYSKLINYGASFAAGEYLLLLNNDTEVITPDAVEEMLGYLQRPEVGVVGAKLFFKDGLVQHAGMLVGPYDALVHVHQYFPEQRAGYLARAIRPGNFSAVTGACQMVRRAVFDEVGGYDEQFAVGFNDADFCLRIGEAGYSTVFTPYARLYHYEFVSRGRETVNAEKELRWKREQALFIQRWPRFFTEGDPFSNPNLKRDNLYFALGD